jgi:hypothetical protein
VKARYQAGLHHWARRLAAAVVCTAAGRSGTRPYGSCLPSRWRTANPNAGCSRDCNQVTPSRKPLSGLCAGVLARDGCAIRETGGRLRRARQQKMPLCRDLYGSDGTRTRDLRRDRPVLVLAGWAGIGWDCRREQDFQPLALLGLAGTGGIFRRPPAGSERDASLSRLQTGCLVLSGPPGGSATGSERRHERGRRSAPLS